MTVAWQQFLERQPRFRRQLCFVEIPRHHRRRFRQRGDAKDVTTRRPIRAPRKVRGDPAGSRLQRPTLVRSNRGRLPDILDVIAGIESLRVGDGATTELLAAQSRLAAVAS